MTRLPIGRRWAVAILIARLPMIGMAVAEGPSIRLEDRAGPAGVVFHFESGSRGRHDLPEILGGGVALIDIDGDGRLDLFFPQGGPIGPRVGESDPPCRLYRDRGDGTFEDVTATANAPGPRYAMGTAVGDVDGDDRDDLFVSGWGDQRLYRNRGDGTFEDITGRAGLASDLWGTSAALADLDGDGDLDLYVCGYAKFDATRPPYCAAPDGRRDYCGPLDLPADPDRLYRNDGGGRFRDVTAQAGIVDREGRGLGVLVADLTGDARPDLYVANDATPAYLFENRGNLRFAEVAEAAGVARDGQGRPLAGMGVAAADLDGDGTVDLIVTNFHGRGTVIFRGLGGGLYRDASAELGVEAATRDVTGFGVAAIDLDGDGRPDLSQANGHVLDRERLGEPLAMRPTVLRNDGRGFRAVRDDPADWFRTPTLGRGLATGDLDGDGRPDLVIASLDAPPRMLRNRSPGRWLAIRVEAQPPWHRSAVGAMLRLTIGGREWVYPMTAGGSYLSASEPTIFAGLGSEEAVGRVEVRWPSGRAESWTDVRPGDHRPIRLREGSGQAGGARP